MQCTPKMPGPYLHTCAMLSKCNHSTTTATQFSGRWHVQVCLPAPLSSCLFLPTNFCLVLVVRLYLLLQRYGGTDHVDLSIDWSFLVIPYMTEVKGSASTAFPENAKPIFAPMCHAFWMQPKLHNSAANAWRRPSTCTLLSPALLDKRRQTQHPKCFQKYELEVWEKIMMIMEKNLESSWNRTITFKAVNLFQTLPPSPAMFLIQWLPQTHLEYGGMILLKSQGKWGIFDGPFDVSPYQNEEGQAIFEMTVKEQSSKWPHF